MEFEGKTTAGYRVRIIATDAAGDYPVVGLVTRRDGTETAVSWTSAGRGFGAIGSLIPIIPDPVVSDDVMVAIFPDYLGCAFNYRRTLHDHVTAGIKQYLREQRQ